MNNYKIIAILIMVLLVFLHVSVASIEEKNEKWCEIYDEAEKLFKEGNWEDAVDDYHLVLAVLPKDTKTINNCGTELKDFTPNKNLGIAYYNLGEYEQAKKYLEVSLRQFSSETAKEYLKKVRLELQKDILAEGHFKQGLICFNNREYEKVIKEMETVLKIRPTYNAAKRYIERSKDIMNIKKAKIE